MVVFRVYPCIFFRPDLTPDLITLRTHQRRGPQPLLSVVENRTRSSESLLNCISHNFFASLRHMMNWKSYQMRDYISTPLLVEPGYSSMLWFVYIASNINVELRKNPDYNRSSHQVARIFPFLSFVHPHKQARAIHFWSSVWPFFWGLPFPLFTNDVISVCKIKC